MEKAKIEKLFLRIVKGKKEETRKNYSSFFINLTIVLVIDVCAHTPAHSHAYQSWSLTHHPLMVPLIASFQSYSLQLDVHILTLAFNL